MQPSSGFSASAGKKRRRKRKGISQQHAHLEETGVLPPRRKDKRRLDTAMKVLTVQEKREQT